MIEKYHFTRKQQEALDKLLEQDEVLLKTKDSGEHFYMPLAVCMK